MTRKTASISLLQDHFNHSAEQAFYAKDHNRQGVYSFLVVLCLCAMLVRDDPIVQPNRSGSTESPANSDGNAVDAQVWLAARSSDSSNETKHLGEPISGVSTNHDARVRFGIRATVRPAESALALLNKLENAG
jgi:hypothetical protein